MKPRFGLMAGSAMPEDLLLRVINKFHIGDIYTNWGMTELSSIATITCVPMFSRVNALLY